MGEIRQLKYCSKPGLSHFLRLLYGNVLYGTTKLLKSEAERTIKEQFFFFFERNIEEHFNAVPGDTQKTQRKDNDAD